MNLKIVNDSKSIITKLGIGCVVCLSLGFAILLHAQDKTKTELIATKPEMKSVEKPEMDSSKMQAMMKMKEQATTQGNRIRERRNRGGVDFGENAAFYKVIIDNNLFRPLGWRPTNNEPAYSLIGTAVGADGSISQATLLEKRSNRYHFVTIGTKLGDLTVKDIQAKQVTLDGTEKPITLKAGELQFLTTGRGRDGGERNEGKSENEGENKNEDNANASAEKRRQAAQQKQASGEWRAMGAEMVEKLKAASEEERREIMQKIREERRERGGRRGRGRDR